MKRFLQYTGILMILVLAFLGLKSLILRPTGPAGPDMVVTTQPLSPVSRGELLNQFRVITVERQYRIPVIGTSYKPLPDPQTASVMGQISRKLMGGRDRVPGTKEVIVYEMVTTATAGIDLGSMTDSHITNDDTVTTITLPRASVLNIAYDPTKSRIYNQETPKLPFVGNSAKLLTEIQKSGEAKHWQEARADEALLARAEKNAEAMLRGLLESSHPGRTIVIRFDDEKSVAAGVTTTPI